MSGWRIGMVGAASDVVAQILKVKSQMDSGMFKPLQLAAVQALAREGDWFAELNAEYRKRRELAGEIFDLIGAKYERDSSGMFLWGRISGCNPLLKNEEGKSFGEEVSDAVLYGCGVFITPGFIFGKNGRDYVRISLCAKQDTLVKAAEKIGKLLGRQIQ